MRAKLKRRGGGYILPKKHRNPICPSKRGKWGEMYMSLMLYQLSYIPLARNGGTRTRDHEIRFIGTSFAPKNQKGLDDEYFYPRQLDDSSGGFLLAGLEPAFYLF